MARIIAIDYGFKRVGLATTDPLQIIASPLETVHSKDLVTYLKNYCAKEEVESIVVGMPKNLDNTDTDTTKAVQDLVKHLKKVFTDKQVYTEDERFTSKMAMQAMIDGGMSKKDRREKGNVDKISAAIILQSFLQSKKL